MIEIKRSVLLGEQIQNILKCIKDSSLKGLTVSEKLYTIKLFEAVLEEVQATNDLKDRLIKEYGSEENGQYKLSSDSENWGTFSKKFSEILSMDVVFDFDKVRIPSDLLSELSVGELILMKYFFMLDE